MSLESTGSGPVKNLGSSLGDLAEDEEEHPEVISFQFSLWQDEGEFMIKDLPRLDEEDDAGRDVLLIKKLHLCSLIYNHSKKEEKKEEKVSTVTHTHTKHTKHTPFIYSPSPCSLPIYSRSRSLRSLQEIQAATIKEIAEYVEDPPLDTPNVFTDEIFVNLVNCFEENAFQPLSKHTETCDLELMIAAKEGGVGLGRSAEGYETILEPSWSYLKVLYELFLKFLGRMKGAILKELVDAKFCELLVEKFNSTDYRERAMLKTLVTKIYVKFVEHRPVIRKLINNAFQKFIYETERHNGVQDLLEVLEPIINGFKAPLKADHLDTLEKTLIPLHKANLPSLNTYHMNLRKCLNIYMQKDPDKCGAIILSRIAMYWPLRDGPKQVKMIEELEDVLEHITKEMWQKGDLDGARPGFYSLMNHIVGSEHFLVAEKGLRLWSNKYLYDGCFNRHEFALEILEKTFNSLYYKSHDHWQNNQGLKKGTGDGKGEISQCKVGDLSLKVLYGYKKSKTSEYEVMKKDYVDRQRGKTAKDRAHDFFKEDDRWEEIRKIAAEKKGREYLPPPPKYEFVPPKKEKKKKVKVEEKKKEDKQEEEDDGIPEPDDGMISRSASTVSSEERSTGEDKGAFSDDKFGRDLRSTLAATFNDYAVAEAKKEMLEETKEEK